MNQPIKDDHDYINRAMKSYDNQSCISLDEFDRDLFLVTNIKKSLRKYINDGEWADETNVRRLVNYFVTLYNCFGSTATDMLVYKLGESEYMGIIVPIITYLGFESNHIAVDINLSIVEDLIKL